MVQTANDNIQRGTICKLIGRKFYGFIATTDKPHGIFFHGSALVSGQSFDLLREGQSVQFKTQLHTVKGTLQAYDVELMKAPAPVPLTTRIGTVSGLVLSKQFGFIQPHDGSPSLFFHWTGVVDPEGFDGLSEGDQVIYLLVRDTKNRPKAVGVARE